MVAQINSGTFKSWAKWFLKRVSLKCYQPEGELSWSHILKPEHFTWVKVDQVIWDKKTTSKFKWLTTTDLFLSSNTCSFRTLAGGLTWVTVAKLKEGSRRRKGSLIKAIKLSDGNWHFIISTHNSLVRTSCMATPNFTGLEKCNPSCFWKERGGQDYLNDHHRL